MEISNFIAGHIPIIRGQYGNNGGVPKFQYERNRLGAVRFNCWVAPRFQINTPIFPVIVAQTILPVIHQLQRNDAGKGFGADVLVFVTSGGIFCSDIPKLATEDDLGPVDEPDLETLIFDFVWKIGCQISGSGAH